MVTYDLYNKQIAYYFGPKCGSRTIIGWAALIKDTNLVDNQPTWFESSRSGSAYDETGELIPAINNAQEYPIRICVIRDPVERFVSAYTNRVLFHQTTKRIITIDELIDLLECKPAPDIDGSDIMNHLWPMTHWYGQNPGLFTHIFSMEQIPDVKNLLEITSNTTLPELRLQQSGNIKKPILTHTQIEWVRERYREDYEIYGKWI